MLGVLLYGVKRHMSESHSIEKAFEVRTVTFIARQFEEE